MPVLNFPKATTLDDGTEVGQGLQYILPSQMGDVPNKDAELVKQQAFVHPRDLSYLTGAGALTWNILTKTEDFVIGVNVNGTMFLNTGATSKITATLPASATATAGRTKFAFFVTEEEVFRVEPVGADVILGFGGVGPFPVSSASPAGVESTGLKGEFLVLLYIGSGIWAAITANGDWE
jgi:hypothetical protein